jgi:uncharacterized protein (DUF169 family)
MSLSASQTAALASLSLDAEPVAVAFLADPPPGVGRVARPQPAGCGYWKEASLGRSFYTTADDHTNCPVGAFTHGVELSAEKSAELQGLVSTMIELKYLKSEEIPLIPHRAASLRVAAYSPLAAADFTPDVVIFRGNVRQIMLLSEAARAAGVFDAGRVMGRPACAMLPQAIDSAEGVTSVGCIGNRVYTGLEDNELYLAVPGARVSDVIDRLAIVIDANTALERFHRDRARAL